MAVSFGENTTDRVTATAASSINNFSSLSWWAWILWEVAAVGTRRVWQKNTQKLFTAADGGGTLSAPQTLDFQVLTSGTNARARTVASNLIIGEWHFVACTYDTGDGPRIWIGDRENGVDQPSYSTRTAGTGSPTGDSGGNFMLGSNGSSNCSGMRVACMGYHNERFDEWTLNAIRLSPRTYPSSRIYWQFLFGHSGTQPDLSGYLNNGSTSALTAADHIPLAFPFGSQIVYHTSPAVTAQRRRVGPLLF